MDNTNSITLNYTVFDNNLLGMTVWLYGDGALLNTSENIGNGTELNYLLGGLNLGQHNWSVKTGNGIKNSTLDYYFFNVINLTINCEAGGPYRQNALVLIQGNVSNGTSGLTSQEINVSIYKEAIYNTSNMLTSLSDGSFQTTFSELNNGNYTLNVSINYQGNNKSCNDSFSIGGELTSASLLLNKIASFHNLTNETFTYNITLSLTNKGGSNATSVNITDSNYIGSNFTIGTLIAGETITRSYLLNFTRNSTVYYNSTSIASAYGIDSLSTSLITANSSSIDLTVPSAETEEQLTLTKNAYFNSENSTTTNYTMSIEVVNSGGIDLAGIVINDQDLNLTTTQSLNRSQAYSYSNSIIVNKEASNLEKEFYKTTATVNSVQYDSNQINIIIPGYGGPADTIAYAPTSVSTSTSFDSIINIINQNQEIGQNFIIDYWITNTNESANYTSGQQTIYVAASSSTNITSTLTSPANAGEYKLKVLTSYIGGPDVAFDSFEVTSPAGNTGGTGGGTGGGSPSGGSPSITGKATEEIVCPSPYMRYGKECCLDMNNNRICDKDEVLESSKNENKTAEGEVINEETPKEEFSFFGIVKSIASNFKVFFRVDSIKSKVIDSYPAELSQNKNYLLIGFGFFIGIIGLFVLIKNIKKRKPKDNTRLKNIIGKEVFAENGNKIGKIKEVYLENQRVYGWLIKPYKKISKKVKKKKILISQKHVKSIGKIMIIEEKVAEHLELEEDYKKDIA
jgi:sporulation protein YlmC with PRC-barrel domain